MSASPGQRSSAGSQQYEYKVVKAPTNFWWFRIKRGETETLLNKHARDGWKLDETVVNLWGGAELFLRRER